MSAELAQLLPAEYVAALLRMDPADFEMEFPRPPNCVVTPDGVLDPITGGVHKGPRLPDRCECHACIKDHDLRENGLPLSLTRMILCPKCGNKRCPRAQDHRHRCTGSNEPGQAAEMEGVA